MKKTCIHSEYSSEYEAFASSDPIEVCKTFVEKIEASAKECYDLIQQNRNKIKWGKGEYNSHTNCTQCEKCDCLFDSDEVFGDNFALSIVFMLIYFSLQNSI